MKTWNKIIEIKSVKSTNTYASEILKTKNIDEGTIIFSPNQSAGRGLGQNSWESEEGKNLTFSIVLFPDFLPIDKQYLLSKVISLGIYDYAKSKASEIKIKWPNDIYYKDKKLAGILIENSIKGSTINHSIAGIGFNLNQEVFYSGALNPVSLKQITGENYSVEKELVGIREAIQKYYLKLKTGQRNEIKREYIGALYRFNKPFKFRWNKQIFLAKITGVNEYGHLQIVTSENEKKEFEFKEIEFII